MYISIMLKTRILLFAVCAILVWLIFQLPKVVVDNEGRLATANVQDSIAANLEAHVATPAEVREAITAVKKSLVETSEKEKNAIFADSLANLYKAANQFDSAAWYAERASEFFNTTESWRKTADNYYQAYTLALSQDKQTMMAGKAQEYYKKVIDADPEDLEAKTNMAMTYITSSNPMQGITMLREVLAVDPQNENALFNMGMLSYQSGQYDRAIDRFKELLAVNPDHIQGQLLLGVSLLSKGDNEAAAVQLEKVKQMSDDPAVHATVDSYLQQVK
jgi:tetratricopeptide (TPR) repeat protein